MYYAWKQNIVAVHMLVQAKQNRNPSRKSLKKLILDSGYSKSVLKRHNPATFRYIPSSSHLDQITDSLPGLCRVE